MLNQTLRRIACLNPATLFLPLAAVFGLLFALVTAPFQAPDEYVHFFRAYHVSEGHLVATNVQLPASVVDFSKTVSVDLPGNDQNKQSKKALVQEFSRKLEDEPRVPVDLTYTLVYSPIPYLPQAIGIVVGRLLHLPPVAILYLARITNLLAWLLLTYTAIRITPVQPRLFFLLALMPMTVFQAASASADALTNGLGFLWIAFIFRLALRPGRDLTRADWFKLALLVIPLTLCKSVYVLLTGLLLLFILRRTARWYSDLPRILAIMLLAVVIGASWIAYSNQFTPLTSAESLTPDAARISYMLSNPGVTARIFWQSFLQNSSFENRSLIGILGWADTPLPEWVYPLYFLLLIFTALLDHNPQITVQIRDRLLAIGLSLAFAIILRVAFFRPEISVGNGKIDPIQGRYLIPFAPLFFFPFYNRRIHLPADSPAWALVAAAPLLFLGVAFRALLWRYYAI